MNKTGDNNGKTRKRIALTLRQKIDICQLLEKGVSRNEIMKEYNVGSSTIYDIKAQKEHILKFMADSDSLSTLDNRKNLRKPKLEQVDSLLYDWYKVMRSDGLPITGKTLMEKAKEFHQHLNPHEQCHFSGGWLARFKIRHGIGKSDITDEVKVREGSDDEHEGYHLEQKLSDYEPELILEERSTTDEKAEYLQRISRNQPEVHKGEPFPSHYRHDNAFQESFALWQSHVSSQYSYPSHVSKLNGSASASQPTFEDPTLVLILSETRMQTAEMRVAMGQLSEKLENIMNKINQLSQYHCQKWWQSTSAFQEESEKRGDWLEEEDSHNITKMKLLAKIISVEEKCEMLEKENISLKKDLDRATAKLLDFETDQLGRISDSVKTALSSVYYDVENKFSNGIEYEGSDIRNAIASSIKEMTEELNGISAEEKMELSSSKRFKLEKPPTLGKRKRKHKAKAKPSFMEVSQSPESNVTNFSGCIEVNSESPKSDYEERQKHIFQKPSDILESTLILQDGEVITLREENCPTKTTKTGFEGKDMKPEPTLPQNHDIREFSEPREEWVPP